MQVADTVTFTGAVQAATTSATMGTIASGNYAHTVTVGWNRRTFTLAANADDTVLDIADMAAIRFLAIYADQALTLKIGADTAALINVPVGWQQQLFWVADVTAVYISNLNASTAAEVQVIFGK
jgi:hypothetical protein